MEYRQLGATGLTVSEIGLGTWVMGGWLWGGADEQESLAAIREALDLGITLIDTAPVYGHGLAEQLVGRVLKESGVRERVVLATKVGLEWDPAKTRVWRNSRPERVRQEFEESLRRLNTDYIDIYQVHWPDEGVPFEDTMEVLRELQVQGLIRYVGVSNFSVGQLKRCLSVASVQVHQPPYNLFERESGRDILPFCHAQAIGTLVYGPLCRGLLAGKYEGTEVFPPGDIRAMDPKFSSPLFGQYLQAVATLKDLAQRKGKSVAQLAIRWCLDQPGVTVALCGARTALQIRENAGASGWRLSLDDVREIDRIVAEALPTAIGPEFMAPA